MLKKTDDEIYQLINPDLKSATSYMEELSEVRQGDFDRMRGNPYPGDDKRKDMGLSTSISKVIANTVNWTQPALVEIFAGDFYRFNFTSTKFANDLKTYVDKVWFRQQSGESVNDDFIYDSQTQRTGGVLKVYHYEKFDLESEVVERMEQEQFVQLEAQEDITISSYEEVVEPSLDPTIPDYTYYENVKVNKKITKFSGPKIECVPAEQFGVTPDFVGDFSNCRLFYHWTVQDADYIRRQENAGNFKKGSLEKFENRVSEGSLASDEMDSIGAEEQEQRFWTEGVTYPDEVENEDTMDTELDEGKPANRFKLYEIYTRLDIDGDGLLEDVIIKTSGNIIFSVEENPYGTDLFVLGRPFRLPHQYTQQTYAEMLEEEQKMMTNLIRLQQDAAAKTTYNNPITSDNNMFNMLKNRKPNTVIKGDPNKIGEVPNNPPNQYIFKTIEQLAGDIENISGVTRYNQGLDANSLNKTFGGMQLIMTASQKRQRLTARRLGWAFQRVIYQIIRCLEMFPTPEFIRILKEHHIESGGIEISDIVVDVGVSFEEKFAIAQQLDGLAGWHAQVGIPAQITTDDELLATVRKRYEMVNVNTEGLIPTSEQYEQRKQQKQQAQLQQQQRPPQRAGTPQQVGQPGARPPMGAGQPRVQQPPR